jgi:CheY-like chemotaxis protein
VQSRGILTALRAAAIVIIATGLNEVLAGALPRYEPLYLYLAAIALVVFLDGLLLGALTALVATSFYALLFMARPDAFSTSVLAPLGVAFATAVAGSILRGLVRSRTRKVAVAERLAPPTPLLMPPIVIDHGEVLTAIDELRGELRSALSDVSHEEARVAEATARADEFRRAIEVERALHTTAAARATDLERTLAEERAAREAEATRLAELQRTLAGERRTREADAARLAELEQALTAQQRTHEADAAYAAKLERALADERRTREAAAGRLTELETALQAARAEAGTRTEALDAAHAEAQIHAARLTELDTELQAARAETTLRSEELAAIRSAANELRRTIEIERARADGERTIRTTAVERITELERTLTARDAELTRLRERMAELQQHVAEERALRERLELDAQSHDATLATLRGRLHGLEQSLESARLRAADQERMLRLRIEELEESLVSDLQSRDAELAVERARLAELERSGSEAHERIASLESELTTERTASDQKLNTIMVHLAQDHEADLGKAVEEREEARAEARSLAMRVTGLQKKLDDQRLALDDAARLLAETRAAAQEEIDRLHARVVESEKAVPLPLEVARPRILIAHPDAELRRNARASLERAGYEIVSAADGLEALRTAIAQRPAVVIADAVMPKMDGRELCQLLKSQEKTAHIRVILLTRSTDIPPKGDLMPDEVLRKPVPLETLKTTLAALLA